jgi:hypothetical protein
LYTNYGFCQEFPGLKKVIPTAKSYEKGLDRFMLEPVTISRNGLNIVFDVSPEGYFRLLHFSALPFESSDIAFEAQKNNFRLVEIEVSGVHQLEHRGSKEPANLAAWFAYTGLGVGLFRPESPGQNLSGGLAAP